MTIFHTVSSMKQYIQPFGERGAGVCQITMRIYNTIPLGVLDKLLSIYHQMISLNNREEQRDVVFYMKRIIYTSNIGKIGGERG